MNNRKRERWRFMLVLRNASLKKWTVHSKEHKKDVARDSSGDFGRCLVEPFRGGSGSFRSVRFRTALEINAVFFKLWNCVPCGDRKSS